MTRRTAALLLLFSVLGLAASTASAWVHYHILRDPSYASFCDISATWSCTAVYESRFGAFRGIPVAIGGLIWFMGALLLSFAAWRSIPPRLPVHGRRQPAAAVVTSAAPAYLFVWSVIGLSFVLYFAYASFVILKTFCILCVLTYVSVIAIFLLSGSGTDIPMRSLPGRFLRDLRAALSSPATLASTVLFVAFAIVTLALFPRQTSATTSASAPPPAVTDAQQSEFERYYTSQPRMMIPVPNDGAKVVIIKFNDYLCPPCRQTFMDYKPVLAKWEGSNPGMVKFMTKDYPLDPECNANAPGGQHFAACEAAAAVRLAREKGRGEAMEEWLFANQPSMTPAMVRQGVREVGRVTDFDAKYQSMLELVKGDIALGKQLGVHATPTFFVNGVRIPGLRAEFFDAAIRYELKQAGVIK